MKILNINNDHLVSHRYGWNKIIDVLNENIKSDIILVDYIDKYFNKNFYQKKEFYYKNKLYQFFYKDVYYNINDSNKNDIFIYVDEIGLYYIFEWFPEFNEFKMLTGALIHNYKKKYNDILQIDKEWIGILHYPEFKKVMKYNSDEELTQIIDSDLFLNSIKNCKIIITLSDFLNNYCKKILNTKKINIPIKTIYHPTIFNCKLFDYTQFINNNSKKIIQIGFWLRKCDTIYNIKFNKNTKYLKYWLPGGEYWLEYTNKIYGNKNLLNDKSVTIKLNIPNNEYDDLFIDNIILLNVFNSSANNTILECISRNTPILVNKHPAIVEYLGEEYPLYFNTIKELNTIINSVDFINNVRYANTYLINMTKDKFTINYFMNEFKKCI